jgi:hypothetical protein
MLHGVVIEKTVVQATPPHENLKIYKKQNYFYLPFMTWKGVSWYSLGNLYGIKMVLISLHFPFQLFALSDICLRLQICFLNLCIYSSI